MARTFERYRNRIIDHVAERADLVGNSRAAKWIRAYCKLKQIPATDEDIMEMSTEAIRRKVIEKFKALKAQVDALKEAAIAQSAEIDTLKAKMQQAQTAFVNLKAKVDQYHP